MTADIRREFIIQSRAYMAGMDVAQPYEICRVKVGNYSPIHLGIVMEDLGRLTVDEADDSHLEEHDHICPEYHSFCDNERLMASDVGISTSDTHMKNAMVLSDGGIKRIDLGRWGYADRQKARMASGGNPLRTPLKS